MSAYKWAAIGLMTPFIYPYAIFLLSMPVIFVKLFDRYFERFFVWRYQQNRMINMREEFRTKLSKEKSNK